MTDATGESQSEAANSLYTFVADEMKAGSDKAAISRKLEEQGVDRSQAEQAVDTIHRQISAAVKAEQPSGAALIRGALGGVAAAVLGAAAWAGIVIGTEYELGIVAWAIGAACGYAVTVAAAGAKGTPLQVLAVLTSALGIAGGKYATFHHYLKQAIVAEYGTEAAADLSLLSMDSVRIFQESIGTMLSGYDALWIGLAVITAWGIPKASGIKLPGVGRGT